MTFGIHNWAELIAALICSGCFLSNPTRLNRIYLPFLWLVFAVEITGKLTTPYPLFKGIMYNIFNGVQVSFYFYFLYIIQEKGFIRKIIPKIFLLFITFFIINFLFLQGFLMYNSYTRLLGTLMLVSVCLLTIWNITFNYLRGTKYYTPALVMIVGIMAFFGVNAANESFYNYLLKVDSTSAVDLYRKINHNLNVVLYGCFAVGLLIEFKQAKASSKNLMPVN